MLQSVAALCSPSKASTTVSLTPLLPPPSLFRIPLVFSSFDGSRPDVNTVIILPQQHVSTLRESFAPASASAEGSMWDG